MKTFATGVSIKDMSQDEINNIYGGDVVADGGIIETIISLSKLASISNWYCVSGSVVVSASAGLVSYLKKCL